MTKAVIRNPIIYHTGPMTIVAYTESEMTYYCTADNVGKLIKYAGTSGVFENGAYYKVVADPIIPEEPDTTGNLLSEPIVVTEANYEAVEGNHSNWVYFKNDLPTLGLEADKQYKIAYTYDGTQYESICMCIGAPFDEAGSQIGYSLQAILEDGSMSSYALSFANNNIMIADKVAMSTTGSPSYNEAVASIMGIPNYGIGASELSLPFTINSITEA